jgi:hypothetical protein
MDIHLSITRKSTKPLILWGLYILFFLFCVTLATESYAEYEYIAGNIFSVITAVIGVLGIGLYFFFRIRSKKAIHSQLAE